MPRREECLIVVRKLWPYLDGALPDRLQEQVAEHLAECAACSSHFEFARAFLAALHEYGRPNVTFDSDALRTRVVQALRAADDPVSS